MNLDEKSVAYALISNELGIYISDEVEFFLVFRLVCLECGYPWYMNLNECFLCGAINPFLFRCSSCRTFQSITKSNKKCNNCGAVDTLHIECANPDCLSNANKKVSDAANRLGGVFNTDSGLFTAQQYCLKCGSEFHVYKSYKMYVRKTNKKQLSSDELGINPNMLSSNSCLLIKYKPNPSTIQYYLYKLDSALQKTLNLDNPKRNLADVVSELFPIK